VPGVGLVIVGVWLVLILGVVLGPAPGFGRRLSLCVFCGDTPIPDFALNLLLFSPFGYALYRVCGSVRAAIAVGLGLSLAVESLQLWIPGRFTSLGDLVANTAGTGAGAIAARFSSVLLRPRTNLRRWLPWAAGLVGTILVMLSSFALAPELPSQQLFVSLTPNLGGHVEYPERIVSASVGPEVLRDYAKLSDQGRTFLADGGRVRIEFVARGVPAGIAPLLQITAGESGEALMLGIRRTDVVLRTRTRGVAIGMNTSPIVFPRVLKGSQGASVRLDLDRVGPGEYLLSLDSVPLQSAGVSSARIWSLWYPAPGVSERLRVGVDLIWLGALAVPIGLWATTYIVAFLAGGLFVSSVWLLPLVTASVAPPLPYIGWCLAILIFGHWAGRRQTMRSNV